MAGSHDGGPQLLLGRGLHLCVDRRDEVVAGLGLGLRQGAAHRALVVDRQGLDARRAAQVVVVLPLEAGAPDQVGTLQHPLVAHPDPRACAAFGQLLVGDRAEIAELVSGVGAERLRILTHGRELCRNPGEVLATFHDLQRHLGVGLVGHRDRLVGRAVEASRRRRGSRAAAQPSLVPHLLEGLVDDLGDLGDQRAPAVVLAQQRCAADGHDQRRAVAGERAAASVQDHAARGRGDDLARRVLGGRAAIVGAGEHLEIPQPPGQRDEQREHEHLHHDQPQPRALAIIAAPSGLVRTGRPAAARRARRTRSGPRRREPRWAGSRSPPAR